MGRQQMSKRNREAPPRQTRDTVAEKWKPQCKKWGFRTRVDALVVLARIQRSNSSSRKKAASEKRDYLCPQCNWWHLTSTEDSPARPHVSKEDEARLRSASAGIRTVYAATHNIEIPKTGLWIDDVRPAPGPEWLWVKTPDEAQDALSDRRWDAVSFDHDLGDDYNTRTVVMFLCEQFLAFGVNMFPPTIYIHTANPVGRRWLLDTLRRYSPEGTEVSFRPYVVE